ncbi:MAG: RNA polymerase sigma factor [Candidatus Marinimicrobia bacterium]|nr:RNA polymerase sigma factor [Candidatus Neomarinimicrobiota bacterium]
MNKLIEKVKSGNVKAFRKLYDLKKDDGFQVCLALCQDRDDATEACQKGFIRIYRSIGTLKEPEYFESWFYRIMMNCSYDLIRQRKFDNIEEKQLIEQNENNAFYHTNLILKSLEDLADGYRTVFILHFFQELKHREIAKIIGCTPENSRSQYARAKQKIKEVLEIKMELNFEDI